MDISMKKAFLYLTVGKKKCYIWFKKLRFYKEKSVGLILLT